jgi:hypothetical protein
MIEESYRLASPKLGDRRKLSLYLFKPRAYRLKQALPPVSAIRCAWCG